MMSLNLASNYNPTIYFDTMILFDKHLEYEKKLVIPVYESDWDFLDIPWNKQTFIISGKQVGKEVAYDEKLDLVIF